LPLEKSMRRVREVVTRPDVFRFVHAELMYTDDYLPDPSFYYFKVGDGLFIYKPQPSLCLELVTAIRGDDIPPNPVSVFNKQLEYLANLGWYKIYAVVCKENRTARLMCRVGGLKLEKDNKINVYSKVIYNGKNQKRA